MNVLPFVGARRKLEWSKHHITDLSRKMGAFFADGAYRYVVVDDPASGQRVMRVERKKPIPDQWGLLLGDAIHSARAALDLMTWEVMKPLNVHPSSAVQFPIGNDRNHYFKQMIPNRKINLAPKSVCNAFYNLEAYPGGDGALLHTLHHLDVLDKHQIIVPAVQAAVLSNFTAKDIDPSYRIPGRINVQNSFFTGELSRLAFWPVHKPPPRFTRSTDA